MLTAIPNFPDYFADEEGNIYSSKKGNRIKKMTPQFQKQWHYYSLRLISSCGDKKHMTIHRLMAITFLPNPDNLSEVNHIDGNKKNNKLSNLEWISKSDNIKHAFSLGLNCSKGTNNGRATLNEDQVLVIYQELLSGESNLVLAEKYDTSVGIISDIKRKSSWQHITKDLPDIKIKFKAEPVSNNVAEFICALLQEGLKPTPVLNKCIEKFGNTSVKIDTVYDIKRRRIFKEISSKYKW